MHLSTSLAYTFRILKTTASEKQTFGRLKRLRIETLRLPPPYPWGAYSKLDVIVALAATLEFQQSVHRPTADPIVG